MHKTIIKPQFRSKNNSHRQTMYHILDTEQSICKHSSHIVAVTFPVP